MPPPAAPIRRGTLQKGRPFVCGVLRPNSRTERPKHKIGGKLDTWVSVNLFRGQKVKCQGHQAD